MLPHVYNVIFHAGNVPGLLILNVLPVLYQVIVWLRLLEDYAIVSTSSMKTMLKHVQAATFLAKHVQQTVPVIVSHVQAELIE